MRQDRQDKQDKQEACSAFPDEWQNGLMEQMIQASRVDITAGET